MENNNILNNEPLYEGGHTGYEQYYIDMEGFWRYIFNPTIQYDMVYGSTPVEDEVIINSVNENYQLPPITLLNTVKNVKNISQIVEKHTGAKSVCEAAAILAASNGELIVEKQKTKNVTLAVARITEPSILSV